MHNSYLHNDATAARGVITEVVLEHLYPNFIFGLNDVCQKVRGFFVSPMKSFLHYSKLSSNKSLRTIYTYRACAAMIRSFSINIFLPAKRS